MTGQCDGFSNQCFVTLNDPGYINQPLGGYAFFSSSSEELEAALRQAINTIQHQSYAFSQSSVASSRVADENFIYEASFQPNLADSYWMGHLEKFQINADGSVAATALKNAGTQLRLKDAATRSIWTSRGGSLVAFNTTNISPAEVGVTTGTDTEKTTRRNEIVGYIRGESAYNPDIGNDSKVMKLGDIFRSSPVTVGTPSTDFRDPRDANKAFAAFRTANPRSSANEKRIVVAGTNLGQLHAFKTYDLNEVWSFIPPNALERLRQIAHKTHPANQQHIYFIDGPISVADVWLGTGDGTAKSVTEWKTLLVFGEGRGANKVLWSTSSNCETGFNNMYKAASGHVHYCGYYALDITDTPNPVYKWRITPTEASAPYLGDPWSKIMIHRVKIDGNEKWVGLLGGGHQLSVCSGGDCDKRGKGFFVIDLSNGNVLWSYTRADDAAMDYAMPAPPTMVDADLDGFIDTAYIGDLGGNIWRFKFCSATDDELLQHVELDRQPPLPARRGHRVGLRGPLGGEGPERQSLALLGNGGQAGTDHRGGRRGPYLCREGHGERRDARPARERHLLEPTRTRTKKEAGISSWPETARRCSRSRPSSAAWHTSRATSRARGAMSASRGRGRPASTPWGTSPPHRQRARATGASRSGTASRRRPSYPSSPAGRAPPICT